jgi:hypothetical protein
VLQERHDQRPYATAAAHLSARAPPVLVQLPDLVEAEFGLDATGTLIDVGCGPGVLAVVCVSGQSPPFAMICSQSTKLPSALRGVGSPSHVSLAKASDCHDSK